MQYGNRLPPEQEAIRARCFHPSGAFEWFDKAEIEQSVPERFAKIVRRYPNRVAIKEKEKAVTYAELNERANHIARKIIDRCGEFNDPVAVLMEQGAAVLIAILAVLKAGKIYVALDPSYPVKRLQYMMLDCQAKLIVAHRHTLRLAREVLGDDLAVIDGDEIGLSLGCGEVSAAPTADDFASIFYTSGTTGQPKGVVDNHRNLLHGTLRFTNGLHVGIEDRLSFTHSCSSSASVRRIFPALLNGACLCPLDVKKSGIRGLLDLLIRESITIFSSGRIRDLVRSFTPDLSFPSLRLVSLGGEIVYRRDVELYRKVFPRECVIGVWMSSTETGNITQYFIGDEVRFRGDVVPIGYASEGMEIVLLDDAGQPIGPGEIGEIAVKSEYLARGYWRRPELTKEKFQVDPLGGHLRIYRTGDQGRFEADGCLTHLGRKDDQLKVRGYRVEAAEIEAALLNLQLFAKAFVTLRQRSSGEKILVAYLVPENWPAPTSSALRKALQGTLPTPMIPSLFVALDSFPLTPNGKIDRNALPEPGTDRPDIDSIYCAPRNSTESALAKIWCEVLSLDRVGIYDNFFDLGGHSLAAIQVVSQVIQIFRVVVPVNALFSSPTVAEMALVIQAGCSQIANEEGVQLMLSELETMTEDEAKRQLFNFSATIGKASGKD